MVLKEWSSVWGIYSNSGTKRFLKDIYSPNNFLKYWWLWISTVLYMSSSWYAVHDSGIYAFFAFIVTTLSFWFLYMAVDRALELTYPEQYEAHAISKHPHGYKRRALRYALFVDGLSGLELSTEGLERIKKYSELFGYKDSVGSFYQHPLIVPLLTATILLSSNYIMQTNLWESGGGLLYIVILLLGLVFLKMLTGMAGGNRAKIAEINRFLKWAELEDRDDVWHKI